MANPELKVVTKIVANGHAYKKHVLGIDSYKEARVPEFKGGTGHGRELNIESPKDLENYLNQFFQKEGTKGFAHPTDGIFYFYNKSDNVMVTINVKDPDLGTVYRPESKAKKFAVLHKRASESGKIHVLDKPEAIESLTNRATKAISLSENGRATYATRTEEITKAEELEKEKATTPDDSKKSTKASDLVDEAVDRADEAAKAVKAARAAKLGKLSLVGTVGLTVVAAGFIDKAYADQRKSAELFLRGGALKADVFTEYIGLNKKVEKMMQAENIAGQGWAFLVTTPIVEAKTASMFSPFSKKHNLSPKVHQALGMSMVDGKSTIGRFSEAAFDAIINGTPA